VRRAVDDRGKPGQFILAGSAVPADDATRHTGGFSKRVDTGKTGGPAALGVIVATGYGYLREDGIQVIPIGILGP
jgi:uncharacterized protein